MYYRYASAYAYAGARSNSPAANAAINSDGDGAVNLNAAGSTADANRRAVYPHAHHAGHIRCQPDAVAASRYGNACAVAHARAAVAHANGDDAHAGIGIRAGTDHAIAAAG